jgi:orotate phosphoribosyltransferase
VGSARLIYNVRRQESVNRAAVARTIRSKSKLSGRFVLRSGRSSTTYFDKYLFESDPKLLRSIAEQMVSLVPDDTEVLCGLELGGIPVVTVLSQLTGLPCAFIRKKRKAYGTMKYAEGPDLVRRRIVLIEDVVSSGGAILDAVEMLRKDGLYVDVAICVIDRQTGGREALEDVGVALLPLFTMDEIEGAA